MRKKTLVLIIILMFVTFSFSAFGKTLFYDNFNDGKVDSVYGFSGKDFPQTAAGAPEWTEKDGVFSQISEAQGDECHAAVKMEFPEIITVQVKIKFLTWAAGDSARGGLGLRVGKVSGRGMDFLCHNTQSTIQFLNDQSAWGISGNYNFKTDKWYWMQFFIDKDNMLHGKIWAEGENEPAGWLLEQVHFGDARPWQDGYPSMNGGTSTHGGSSTMSFDEFQIWDENGPSPTAVVKKNTLVTTWGAIK